jgi:hypothetical protein
VKEATALLFDEFAAAYRRGDSPDVLAYLERARDDADAFAALIDRFLQSVPARASTEEEIVLMHARLEHEAPILVLRQRRALTREAVVDALVRVLELDAAKRGKVGGYYHELEVGLLDPQPVDARVWGVLADILKANVRRLAEFRPSPPSAHASIATYHRLPDEPVSSRRYSIRPAASSASDEADEIDRLFTGSA